MQPIKSIALAENHPHVQAIKNYQAAMSRQDLAEARSIFEPGVIYSVPGNNKLSGTFKGADEVMSYFSKLMEITRETYKITRQQWMVNDNKVALFTDNYAEIGDKSHAWKELIIFEFVENKKHYIEMFQDDQAALDTFYGGS